MFWNWGIVHTPSIIFKIFVFKGYLTLGISPLSYILNFGNWLLIESLAAHGNIINFKINQNNLFILIRLRKVVGCINW